MDSRIKSLNRALKQYDSKLFAQCTRMPRIDIYRASSFGCNPPYFLFPLTQDWTIKTRPVEWGIEVVLARLKAHDLWANKTVLDRMEEENQKVDESKEREFKNNVESFFYDFRRQFARATDDINTANMKKLYRKENGHGYCEPRLGFVSTGR